MRITDKLVLDFLGKAKALEIEANPIKILRSNTYNLGQANVLVRTASDLGKRYFFGINYINLEEIYNLDNSFVAFICGSIDKIIFFPTDILVKNLPQISHDRNGEYKLNFTRDLKLVLRGRGKRIDCVEFINNWNLILNPPSNKASSITPDESFHAVIEGRLLEIGNIRGYKTYSPDNSRTFNKRRLDEIATLAKCPDLQFSDYNLLRNIDTIWFRETNDDFYPEYAFEVELSTGIWSGVGRLASLREYNTKLYVITYDHNKFTQVSKNYPDIRTRYFLVMPDKVGLLYSAELNLIRMRNEFNL